MPYKLKRMSREVVAEGSALTYCQDEMRLPNGRIEKWDFIHHNRGGGSAIVPVLPDGRILLIRQLRPAVDREFLELPAGAKEAPDEDPKETALRELQEETGYRCGKLTFLTRIMSAPAFLDETTDIFLAEELTKVGEQSLDEAEEIRLCPCEASELKAMIQDGVLQDAKTVVGILTYLLRG